MTLRSARPAVLPLLIVPMAAGLLLGGPGYAGDSPAEEGQGVFVFSVPLSGTYMKKGDEEEQRIAFIQGPYVAPRLSPDGHRLLLNSRRGGTAGVWLAGGEGWPMERVCDGDQTEWSPDGKRIVFRRAGAIVERELAAGGERTASPPDCPSCRFPSYSPDGRILFVSTGEKGDTISVISLEGGASLELLSNAEIKSTPKCAPDGGRIAYQDGAHINLVDFGRGKTTRLTMAGGVQSWPVWSRDGKSICYCQSPGFPDGPRDIYHLEIGTPLATRLVRRKVDVGFDWNGFAPETDSSAALRGGSITLRLGKGAVVPGGDQQPLKGEVVVENDWLRLRLSTATGKASLAPRDGAGKGGEMDLALFDGAGRAGPRTDRVRVVRSDADEVVLEALPGSALFRMGRTRPAVEVRPPSAWSGVYLKRRMGFAVVPDRLADDLVYDPRSLPARCFLPATPILLGCLPSPAGLAVVAAPGSSMILVKDAAGGSFAGVRISGAEMGVFISVIPGADAWREAKVKPRHGGKGWEVAWSSPFHAQWRLAAAGKGGNYSRTWNEDALAALKKPVLDFEAEYFKPSGPSLVYLQGRSWHTPLGVLTPMDILQDVLGLDGCRDALDLEGIRTYRTADRWVPFLDIAVEDEDWDIYSLHTKQERDLGILEAFGGIRKADTEGIRSITTHLGDDILGLLQGLDARIGEYRDFFAGVEESCRAGGKGAGKGYPGSVLPRIGALRDRCANLPVTGIEKVTAALDVVKNSLGAEGGHEILINTPEFRRLHKVATVALSERQKVLGEYRGLAKSLREEAGVLMAHNAGLAGPAGEMRALTGRILRKRYYLEGDWRGEEPLGTEGTGYRR